MLFLQFKVVILTLTYENIVYLTQIGNSQNGQVGVLQSILDFLLR